MLVAISTFTVGGAFGNIGVCLDGAVGNSDG
jgi:hypothetical protein